MLAVKFTRIRNVVVAEILEQGEEIKRGKFSFKDADGEHELLSRTYPSIQDPKLYLRGVSTRFDGCATAYIYESAEEAKKAVKAFTGLIKQYNKTHANTISDTSPEVTVAK